MIEGNMGSWTSEITNNPDDDFNLYIELLNDEDYIGRIFRDKDKMLKLQLYCEESINIPCEWLSEIINRAKNDI